MRLFDHNSLYKYFHTSPERFDSLLAIVGPLINSQSTYTKRCVSAGEKLAVTIRYLVTGHLMQSISISYRLGHSTASIALFLWLLAMLTIALLSLILATTTVDKAMVEYLVTPYLAK
uniref:Uncharacterized protein n=1 Tax=Amphimedon queenslandica TaxID=400682 RepID=A0A1X7VSS1_AMPQE